MNKPESGSVRKCQAAASRRRLLLAGMAAFADRGYEGASIRDIVSPLGCSVASVSVYFGSKEALSVAVVDELAQEIVKPICRSFDEIRSDFMWRTAVKNFVLQVISVFNAKEEPNCYFAALYRHESANLHAKKVTLHEKVVQPIFRQLEHLISFGVADRTPLSVRLATLALWNGVIAYALKHPDEIAEDVPEGMDPARFMDATVDYMIEKSLAGMRFVPTC